MKGKSLIGVILAAICVTVTYLLPGSEELSHEGITALGVLGMASILWISNTLPFGVTGLLALVMLVLLGVSDMASVFVGCILALDGVENVAVVGLKDDHLGEAVTAVIVKAPGAELDEATVRNWCKGKIAGFMKPRKVFFVNELPVNSTGKIDKRKLTEMFN